LKGTWPDIPDGTSPWGMVLVVVPPGDGSHGCSQIEFRWSLEKRYISVLQRPPDENEGQCIPDQNILVHGTPVESTT
jgi:hypothetical protein